MDFLGVSFENNFDIYKSKNMFVICVAIKLLSRLYKFKIFELVCTERFIIYDLKKSTKWRIRIYTKADSNTSYVYDIMELSTEKLIRLSISIRIPLYLYKMLLDKIFNA